MQDLDLLYRKFLPWLALALSAVVFALAPFLIYLQKSKEQMTRRALTIQIALSIWLLLANTLCGLVSYGYLVEKLGYGLGVIGTVLATAFGGAVAYGTFEAVFNRRQKVGERITKKALDYFTKEEGEGQ